MINIKKYPIKIQGSVKNIRVVKEVTQSSMGEYIFEFTDDTSVKDKGKLGFETKNKGASMCETAVYNCLALEQKGIPTIFREKVAENAILVDGVQVLNPDEIDFSQLEKRNCLFPVEVISRDIVTSTSSAAKRLRSGKLHYEALGLSKMPRSFPVVLPKTYVDGSTKLRGSDEYLPWDQLKELAYASTADMNQVDRYVRETTRFGLEQGARAGFLIFDHKDEYAYNDEGDLILADIPLCLDEITGAMVGKFADLDDFRGSFTIFRAGTQHEGYVNASKQIYRDHYDAKHPSWCEEVRQGLLAGVAKSDLPVAPQPPEALVTFVSNIYQAFANAWIGEKKFEVEDLDECCQQYKKWATEFYELRP
jgi:phosphoribosylaminoimidazole-succinocarboxamide synthase